MDYDTKGKVLKKAVVWNELYFYRKSDAIYQLTVEFCKRFLPAHGDRTVDQMVQAARSGKQNIVEGSEDGQTSSEMEIKLLNVARGSLQELRLDYQDYLNTHHLPMWPADSERQQRLREFCHSHNDYSDYAPFVVKMSDEEMANLLLTLCHQTDKMMCSYIEKLEHRFVTEGGIKERMYAARTGYRQTVDAHVQALEAENQQLKTKVKALEEELKKALERLGDSRKL
ncbi:MAG: four helix bundle suffix domain-containing protein [Bacteroidaceae bacterium]|jgi:four helix bundle suffix protein|nr:four helix bundle suffix domain-containing protein [Bacteroidaceae bacterium]MBQ5714152.1 four helix bundle suffix domain-containing protein [Bacteroidaceae bacterium]